MRGAEPLAAAMARREAAALLLPAPEVHAPSVFETYEPAVAVRVIPCPWCGAGLGEGRSASWPGARSLRGCAVLARPGSTTTLPELAVLHCESLVARSLLPLLAAVHAGERPGAGTRYSTRGAALAQWGIREMTGSAELSAALLRLDAAERWAGPWATDPPGGHGSPGGPMAPRVLPASTRPHPRHPAGEGRGVRDPGQALRAHTARMRPHFLGPHGAELLPVKLRRLYRAHLLAAVDGALRPPVPGTPEAQLADRP